MSDDPGKNLQQAVKTLHSTVTMTVHIEPAAGGKSHWTATTSGEDFLNGTWTEIQHGKARSATEAAHQAVRAFWGASPKKKTWWRFNR